MSKNTVLYQYIPYNHGFKDGEMPMCLSNYDYKLINTIFESYATYDGLADDDVKKLRVMLFPWILYSGEAIFEEMQGELFQMNIDSEKRTTRSKLQEINSGVATAIQNAFINPFNKFLKENKFDQNVNEDFLLYTYKHICVSVFCDVFPAVVASGCLANCLYRQDPEQSFLNLQMDHVCNKIFYKTYKKMFMKDMGIFIKDTKKYSILFNDVPPTIEECLNKLSDSTDVFKAFGPLKLEEHNYTMDEAAPSLTSPLCS